MYEREPKWKCPDSLELKEVDMGKFKADFITRKAGAVSTGVSATDENSESKKGIILQLHGGGYYERIHNTYRDMAALYNELSDGWDVLSPDYRVAPEHPYPAALEDAIASYKWILDRDYLPENIIVAGDSAGGGLSLALVLYLRDHEMPLPAGIITMSAWTDLTKSGESYEENFNIDPIFGGTKDTMVYMDGYYKEDDPHNPYISPIFGDMTGFPPMLMQVGDREVLLSDTLSVSAAAKKAGVLVKTHVYPGMFHVFQMGLSLYPESKEAWEEVSRFIRIVKGMEKNEE
ncbi:MAG: alpha/beta hydrolase [Lachnospiraceae bacterium]|nr:alpha/beta hydrolase [Lachnospiraceae bacterium]